MAKNICSIPGCGQSCKGRGWCPKHYAAWRQHGHPLGLRAIYADMMGETWLPVVGFEELYEVSDQGRVRTVKTLRIRKQTLKDERLVVNLLRGGERTGRKVHQLVLEAFVGRCPPGQLTRHGPGGRQDNRLVNLSYGTPHENNMDMFRDQTASCGARNGQARLSEKKVREIRARYAMGDISQRALAAEYGVSRTIISKIVRGIVWKHIQAGAA